MCQVMVQVHVYRVVSGDMHQQQFFMKTIFALFMKICDPQKGTLRYKINHEFLEADLLHCNLNR